MDFPTPTVAEQITAAANALNESEIPWGNPAGMIADLQRVGWQRDDAYSLVTQLGVSISQPNWDTFWGQVAADAVNRSNLGGLDLASSIPREFHSPWSAGQPGRFAYQSEGYVWETLTNPDGTTSTFLSTLHNTTYSTTPLTPDEVLADLEANAENAISQYPKFSTYVGGFVTAAYFTVGRAA